jgi:tRNA(fMet)-specific endonuclease VapC
MFVLDTNTLIYFFKGIGNVPANFLRIQPQDIAIPCIVVFELQTGIAKSTSPQKRRRQLDELLSNVTLLSFGRQEADHAAEIRASLEIAGMPIGPYDILIAATASANNATLVTHNTKEFGRIAGLDIIDWY